MCVPEVGINLSAHTTVAAKLMGTLKKSDIFFSLSCLASSSLHLPVFLFVSFMRF